MREVGPSSLHDFKSSASAWQHFFSATRADVYFSNFDGRCEFSIPFRILLTRTGPNYSSRKSLEMTRTASPLLQRQTVVLFVPQPPGGLVAPQLGPQRADIPLSENHLFP